MKKLSFLAFAILVSSFAFAQEKPAAPTETKPVAVAATKVDESLLKGRQMGQAVPLVFEKDKEIYGAQLKMKDSTKLADVMKDPKTFEGKALRMTATIDSVCQKKGCWMVLKDGTAETRVKFTDYKFFVPLDVSGRTVTVEGKPEVKVIPEAMRRHYAQDAGKSKEEIAKIVGDETTVVFMADAVEIGGKPCCEKPAAKDGCCEDGAKEGTKPAGEKKDAPKEPAKKDGAAAEACGSSCKTEAGSSGSCCGTKKPN